MKNPTLRQIAAACGCNVSTVSRAISRHRNVSEANRRRILAVARRLGWRPNPLASAYMSHLRSTREPHYQANLAFVISLPAARRLTELPGYHQDVFAGARDRAASLGYKLEPIWFSELGYNAVQLSRVLKSRGILGVILHAGLLGEDAFAGFDWPDFAMATWGFSLRAPAIHRSAHHMAQAMRMTLTEIRRRGYERIAVVLSSEQNELTDYAVLSSFYYEQRTLAAPARAKLYSKESPGARREIEAWLRASRPEVIIGDQLVWEALQELQWRVPEDVSFVSPAWHGTWPEIAGIDHCPRVIGASAMDLVTAQIVRNERGVPEHPKLLLHDGCWRDGPSLKDRSVRPGKPAGRKGKAGAERAASRRSRSGAKETARRGRRASPGGAGRR